METRHMAHATDIVGYTYRGDVYCPGCILKELGYDGTNGVEEVAHIEEALDFAARHHWHINRHDEPTFDSGEFPKVVFRSMLQPCGMCGGTAWQESDVCKPCSGTGTADRCGSCGEVLGA